MNIYGRIHSYIGKQIDPAFDILEKVCDKHKFIYAPSNAILIAMLPAWFLLGQFLVYKKHQDK